jgi:hypothetical protein
MHGGMKKLTLKGQCNESLKLNPETNQFLSFPWGPDFSPIRIFQDLLTFVVFSPL